jgi:hypothetical protein
MTSAAVIINDPKMLFSRQAAFWLVVFLCIAYTAGYAWSTPHTDTADELLRGYEIRHGLSYPVEGPFLGGAVHLGPIWFYLIAVPLWISHSWLAVALFVGLVCSAKFPLAYVCGRNLIDRDFGTLWAIAMLVPGWGSFEQLIFLNPNAVAATILLVLAISLRAIERPGAWPVFAVLGFAIALSIHVHPTAIPVFILLWPVLWAQYRRGHSIAHALIAMAAGFFIPFLPYIANEFHTNVSDWQSASGYVSHQVNFGNIVNAPSVIFNYLYAGPAVVAEYLMHWNVMHATWLGMGMALAALVSLAGLRHPDSRSRLLVFSVALLVFAAWIACMRPTTPVQFTWVLGPIAAGLVAIGLWSLSRVPALRVSVWVLLGASIAFDLFAVRAMAITVRSGDGRLPSRILDIKDQVPRAIYRDVWFPALSHGRLGRILCGAGQVSLHGHLAYIADRDLGLDLLFQCNARSQASMVGSEGHNHYFGMTRPFWHALGAVPDCWAGSLGLLTRGVTPLLHRNPIPLADGATYLPRVAAHPAPARVTFTVTAPGDAAVMITNVLDGYEAFEIASAQVDGQPASPVAQNDISSLFASHVGGAEMLDWTFTVVSTNVDAVDVVAIDPRSNVAKPKVGALPGEKLATSCARGA